MSWIVHRTSSPGKQSESQLKQTQHSLSRDFWRRRVKNRKVEDQIGLFYTRVQILRVRLLNVAKCWYAAALKRSKTFSLKFLFKKFSIASTFKFFLQFSNLLLLSILSIVCLFQLKQKRKKQSNSLELSLCVTTSFNKGESFSTPSANLLSIFFPYTHAHVSFLSA